MLSCCVLFGCVQYVCEYYLVVYSALQSPHQRIISKVKEIINILFGTCCQNDSSTVYHRRCMIYDSIIHIFTLNPFVPELRCSVVDLDQNKENTISRSVTLWIAILLCFMHSFHFSLHFSICIISGRFHTTFNIKLFKLIMNSPHRVVLMSSSASAFAKYI